MNMDAESSNRRIPTLVQLCQRVASTHVDSIISLGDDLTYPLVKPVLERCSPEQLLRLELESPHLQNDTPEIWRALCHHKYPLAVERHSKLYSDEPPSWKDHFFSLQEEEAKRLEEAATKLRNQRLEADGRKKEREVKFTDRVPLPKRARTASGWSTNVQPKTLFQKTKSEASKIQRTMYSARIIPPMPSSGRAPRVLSKPDAALLLMPTSNDTNRVTVSTVMHRRPCMASSKTPSATYSTTASQPKPQHTASIPQMPSASSVESSIKQIPLRSIASTTPSNTTPFKASLPGKKDPMASLFVPKHRAYSQRLS